MRLLKDLPEGFVFDVTPTGSAEHQRCVGNVPTLVRVDPSVSVVGNEVTVDVTLAPDLVALLAVRE